MNDKVSILLLCTGNSCRSQMAEGYLRHFVGERVDVYSAGVETHGVNLKAIAIMKEDGIDITAHTSNHVEDYLNIPFDFVITVCDSAAEKCPVFPSKAIKIHYSFDDPAKAVGGEAAIQATFREVRDQIKSYCKDFVASNLA